MSSKYITQHIKKNTNKIKYRVIYLLKLIFCEFYKLDYYIR